MRDTSCNHTGLVALLTLINRKASFAPLRVRIKGLHKNFRVSPKYSVMADYPTIHLREGMESFVNVNSVWLLDKIFELLLL